MDTNTRMGLYLSSFCGYCFRVKRAVSQLGIPPMDLDLHDVTRAPRLRQDIFQATGRTTVPVLRVPRLADGTSQPGLDGLGGLWDSPEGESDWLFESRDIVRFLTERYGADSF